MSATPHTGHPPRTALVMAGGTGGHIFPGLAVARALRDAGWRVHWLGGPASAGAMESRLVPPEGFAYETLDFGGVRGKGARTLLQLPLRLARAQRDARAILRRVQPDVVLGLGGYITFPAGLMAAATRRPLVLHEQNSIAGMANRTLAKLARRVFTAFPHTLPRGEWIGNPLRQAFTQQPPPATRFEGRSGPLKLLVIGGSLGAKALNDTLPLALNLIPEGQRPLVTHQCGEQHLAATRAAYEQAGVVADVQPFIPDTASAFADADLVVCRAGASTVTELAAVGAAALFVPFPHAVDDHQTHNARFLVESGGGWLMPQSKLTPYKLAEFVQSTPRAQLLAAAQEAHKLAQLDATQVMVHACETLVPARAAAPPLPRPDRT